MHTRHHLRLVSLAVALLLAPGAAGQCPPDLIKSFFGLPKEHGADGEVRAILGYAPPDGSPAMLIVGGAFTHIGGITVNNIAAWDGTYWHDLDGGTDNAVNALAVWNGYLIVGGRFTNAGGQEHRRVAGWNGNGWMEIGNGIGENIAFWDDEVNAFATTPGGTLYAAGSFEIAGTASNVNNIVSLSGPADTTWGAVAGGLPGTVYALEIFDEDGAGPDSPKLFAGGQFTGVRKLDAGWIDIQGPLGIVSAMTVTNEGLIVGGNFWLLEGGATDPHANSIARWDGSEWSRFESGGAYGVQIGQGQGRVRALQVFGNNLIVAGRFDSACGVAAEHIAAWNGSAFQPFGGGVTADPPDGGVWEMHVYQGSLVVGGAFHKTDSASRPARNIVRHDGASWLVYFAPRTVLALTPYHNRLVAGGYFASSGIDVATNAYHLSSWNGSAVHASALVPLGSGVNGQVNALKPYVTGSGTFQQHMLVAGGEFTQAGGLPANRIAQWNESDFLPGSEWSPMGAGFNSTVHALEHFNGRVVAAGQFTASGATPLNRIARWTDNPPGSPYAWHPMGSGFNAPVIALKQYPVFFQSVQLVAAGDFTTAGGTSASRIASWTESLSQPSTPTWQPMGPGFNDRVYAVERHNGSTYAAGAFTMSGGTAVNRIARWTGSAWVPVGSSPGGGFNSSVYALLSHGGYLYATGAFTSADGTTAVRLARWDGSTWSAVDGGLDSYGFALSAFQTEIAVGGEFLSVGSDGVISPGVARLLLGVPWISAATGSPPGGCHELYEFTVDAAWGYTGVSFQWRRNGVPLVNGATGAGSTISGAATDHLRVWNALDADEGTYDCIVSTPCGGSSTSPAMALEIIPLCSICPADIVVNDAVDVDDLLAVIAAWGSCPAPCAADIAPPQQPDGMVDVNDLLAVIGAWGPCPENIGACCVSGTACASMSEAQCLKLGGEWHGNILCADAQCPPINDECQFATIAVAGDNPLDTRFATTSTAGVPSTMCGQAWSRDVWYAYTPNASGPVAVGIGGQWWDSIIEVYTAASSCGSLAMLTCADDAPGCVSCHGNVGFNAVAGSTYLIRIASWSTTPGGEGDVVISGP